MALRCTDDFSSEKAKKADHYRLTKRFKLEKADDGISQHFHIEMNNGTQQPPKPPQRNVKLEQCLTTWSIMEDAHAKSMKPSILDAGQFQDTRQFSLVDLAAIGKRKKRYSEDDPMAIAATDPNAVPPTQGPQEIPDEEMMTEEEPKSQSPESLFLTDLKSKFMNFHPDRTWQ